jgi:hypothetical protein
MEIATQSINAVRLFAYSEQWEDLVDVCTQSRTVTVLDHELGICILQIGPLRARLERLEREHPKTWNLALADVAVSFELKSDEKTRETFDLQLRAEHVHDFLRALLLGNVATAVERAGLSAPTDRDAWDHDGYVGV